MLSRQHPNDEMLLAFAAGRLADNTWSDVESHLSSCRLCADRLGELSVASDPLVQYIKATKRPLGNDSSQSVHDDETQAGRATPSGIVVRKEVIGRYQVESLLGKGGFGDVLLAWDPTLERHVALKIPRTDRFACDEDLKVFIHEARTAAQLRHPGLVSVYDVHLDDAQGLTIVQEYVEGENLSQWMQQQADVGHDDIVRLLIEITEAVGHAHQHGLVHRDLKPENILIDRSGKPHVTDFGLALHETMQREHAGEVSGTPAYMSPEQVRGESHRLDGRTDLWSLGVILYELLTQRRPFAGDSKHELFEEIKHREPRPPRQIRPSISAALERTCLKCLQKRPSDRYLSAAAFVDDLSSLSRQAVMDDGPSNEIGARQPRQLQEERIAIIPKGLRSFDEHDAGFFLQLLPGARDLNGLPDSIRFWKHRIEETDQEKTFFVGLIYGPSGCGKSSFVKAGLLPHLSGDVSAVCIEATPEETESGLQRALHSRFPALRSCLTLTEAFAALRQRPAAAAGKKVLIVLDQFEQWLHGRMQLGDAELVQALRQCDGRRVQCIVSVRDDFWMATTRFMRELEVPLIEGHNSAAVDLFDMDHARTVLAAYGQAFGRFSADDGEPSQKQHDFLTQSITQLSDEGRVVCVRLALFAQMMKARPWTTASVRQLGGTEGLGAMFLEETFSASTAPPAHRLHQKAARAVLSEFLPQPGTDIKGQKRPFEELLASSGYGKRPRDFDELLHILDKELRLITPCEAEVPQGNASPAGRSNGSRRYYQLTHDYLVPSIREWVTRKKKETRRGRAELRLSELATAWQIRPNNGNLPAWWEYLNLRLATRTVSWSERERRMMRRAGRLFAIRATLLASVCAAALGVGFIVQQRQGELETQLSYSRYLQSTYVLKDVITRAQTSDYVYAAAEADRILREESVTPAMLYNIACVFATAADSATHDDARTERETSQLRREYSEKATRLLWRAHDTGYFESPDRRAHLSDDADLQAIYDHPEFRGLLTRLGVQ